VSQAALACALLVPLAFQDAESASGQASVAPRFPAEAAAVLSELAFLRGLIWPSEDEDLDELGDELPVDEVLDRCRKQFPGLKIRAQPAVETLWKQQQATTWPPSRGNEVIGTLDGIAMTSSRGDVEVRWLVEGDEVVFVPGEQAVRSGGVLSTQESQQTCATLRHWTRIEWRSAAIEVDEDQPPRAKLAGQVMLQCTDEQRYPFSWPQELRVVVSRAPDVRPDWSHGVSERDSVWEDVITSELGEFSVAIPLRELQRTVDHPASFCVGVAMSDLEPIGAELYGDRILPHCISAIELPGQAALPVDLEIVHEAPALHFESFDPARLVRAVNTLRAAGAAGTLRLLERYAELCPSSSYVWGVPHQPIGADTADTSGFYAIVRSLFDSKHELIGFLSMSGTTIWPQQPCAPAELVQRYPLLIVDDFPFLVAWARRGSGPITDPLREIRWAREHGVLREARLRPPDDPTQLVARVEVLLGDCKPSTDVRRQVWNAVAEAIELPAPERCSWMQDPMNDRLTEACLRFFPIDDEEWATLLQRVSERGLRWDDEQMAYKRLR
jgi:hypothetical protein